MARLAPSRLGMTPANLHSGAPHVWLASPTNARTPARHMPSSSADILPPSGFGARHPGCGHGAVGDAPFRGWSCHTPAPQSKRDCGAEGRATKANGLPLPQAVVRPSQRCRLATLRLFLGCAVSRMRAACDVALWGSACPIIATCGETSTPSQSCPPASAAPAATSQGCDMCKVCNLLSMFPCPSSTPTPNSPDFHNSQPPRSGPGGRQ